MHIKNGRKKKNYKKINKLKGEEEEARRAYKKCRQRRRSY
jgi:hypothetical protein